MPRFYRRVEDLPELEGWWTTTQIAERLGVTRQRVIGMVLEGKFPNAKRISSIILIPESDIDDHEAKRGGGLVRRASESRQNEFPHL